uniref:(northern house mosquito) hypothetical protein n=1 Tax=Culex pipiens TaxID=7175 RepID=A0A8D8JUS8_CULPI
MVPRFRRNRLPSSAHTRPGAHQLRGLLPCAVPRQRAKTPSPLAELVQVRLLDGDLPNDHPMPTTAATHAQVYRSRRLQPVLLRLPGRSAVPGGAQVRRNSAGNAGHAAQLVSAAGGARPDLLGGQDRPGNSARDLRKAAPVGAGEDHRV